MANIVTSGLQLYLNSLQGVAGATWQDLSGSGNNATLNGNVTAQANGMTFGGTGSDYATLPTPAWFKTASDMTFEARIIPQNVPSGSGKYLYLICDGTGYNAIDIGYSSGTELGLYLFAPNGSGSSSHDAYAFVNGTQYYLSIAYAYSTGTFSIYINGALQTTITGTTGGSLAHSSSTTMGIGDWPTNATYALNGVLDNIRIYNRSLSASEVSQNYSVGTAVGLPSGGTVVTATVSGGSVSGGSSTSTTSTVTTVTANASGGSTTGGVVSKVAYAQSSTVKGGSVSGGSSAGQSTLNASAYGGSNSSGSASAALKQIASVSGGSTSGGNANGGVSATVAGSVNGGSVSGGNATGTTGAIINASASGGSVSNGKITNVASQQTASVNSGSTSGGQSSGVIFMQVSSRGGSVTGGNAFAQLLQKALANGGSVSGGESHGGAIQTITTSVYGGSVSGGGVNNTTNPPIIRHAVTIHGEADNAINLQGKVDNQVALQGQAKNTITLGGEV